MTTQRYKPMTEDEIRALVQERIKKKSFQPRYSHARWDEMRYLPSDDESFAEKAAFAVAIALALKGQKPEPLERYRLDWKPGARTNVDERRRWRARWAWAPHGPCMITRLNDKGNEIRLGPDLSKYLFEEEPPHLIAPPEPTQMILPPEGDTYAFDWHLEQATKELAELRKVRREMKSRAKLTDRYVTWVFKDGQWRGYTLANPRDFLGLAGAEVRFTGHPDESPIPTNQYPALRRFPGTEEYGPWKEVKLLPAGGEVLKGVEARRRDFLILFGEWREGKPLRTAEVLSPDFRVLSGGWRRGRRLELGPPTIPANMFDTDPKLAMFWTRRLDVSKHPVLDVNWEWRHAGVREALYDLVRKNKWLSKERKRQINRAHYLNGLASIKRHLEFHEPAYPFWTAPVDIVSYSGETIKRAGERIDLGTEAAEDASRVIVRQRAKRRQLAAVFTLAGYVSAGTREYSYGVPSNLARALEAVESYYKDHKDRFGVYLALRPFRLALDMELPGAIYLAAHDGRPADTEYGDEGPEDDLVLERYQRSAKAYNEQLRKLGYRRGAENMAWDEVPEGKPLPKKPLETETQRLAKDARAQITYANRRCRTDFTDVVRIRDEDELRKLMPDTRSDGTDPENGYQDTRGWQLYDRRHQPEPAEYDIEAAIAEGDVLVGGSAYADPELNPGLKEELDLEEIPSEDALAIPEAPSELESDATEGEDDEDYRQDFETDQGTFVRYEHEETGERHTVETSKLTDLRHELDGQGPSRFGLTERQREVFGCYYGTSDMTVHDITEQLKVSKRTVQNELSEIRRKMAEAGIRLPAQAERRGRKTA